MTMQTLSVVLVFSFGIITFYVFCKTKNSEMGFGRYHTSIVLLILAITVAGMLTASGIMDINMSGILFAVIGFAGGLFSRENSK